MSTSAFKVLSCSECGEVCYTIYGKIAEIRRRKGTKILCDICSKPTNSVDFFSIFGGKL